MLSTLTENQQSHDKSSEASIKLNEDSNNNDGCEVTSELNVLTTINKLCAAFELGLNNNWDAVYQLINSGDSYIHLWAASGLQGHSALLSLDKRSIEQALSSVIIALEKVHEHRKKDTGLVFNATGDSYTDEQCIAELAYAQFNSWYGALNALADPSLIGFVKSAYRVNICFKGYRKCEKLMKEKKNWTNHYLQKEFEAGVHIGLGIFDVSISLMPRRYSLLLEMVGYDADLNRGIAHIEAAAATDESIPNKLVAKAESIIYQVFTEHFFGLGEMKRSQVINDIEYFTSILHYRPYMMVADGLRNYILGDFDSASEQLTQVIQDKLDPPAIRFGLTWLQAWIAAIRRDWMSAVYHADLLVNECVWSRAAFSYMKGIFIFMLIDSDESMRSSRECEMMQCFANVPKLKRNWGGQKAFHEKLVLDRSKQMIKHPESIVMPHLDLIYLWNMLPIASSNRKLLETILQDIKETRDKLNRSNSLDADKELYLLFMTAIVQRHLGEDDQAIDAFIKVIESADQLKREVQLPPQACLELALIYRKKQDKDQATYWCKKAKKYSNYLTEVLIKYRGDLALQSMADW